MRTLMDEMDVFTCEAHNDLLSDRKPNEAYCLANPGEQYAVYFPDGGEVTLDISDVKGGMKAKWLDIAQSKWKTQQTLMADRSVTLRAPQSGPWVVLVGKMRAGGKADMGACGNTGEVFEKSGKRTRRLRIFTDLQT
jgi:hypothetical protein